MGLSADERKLLDELTAKASQPDADDDFEIEIFSGDKGARIPFSKGARWLFSEFGIGEPPAPAGDDGTSGGGADGGKDGGKDGSGPARGSYFSKRAAGGGGK